jgi:hypothetical protein
MEVGRAHQVPGQVVQQLHLHIHDSQSSSMVRVMPVFRHCWPGWYSQCSRPLWQGEPLPAHHQPVLQCVACQGCHHGYLL